MKLYIEYSFNLFILWFNSYVLKKHNILKPKLNKKLKFNKFTLINLFLVSIVLTIFLTFIFLFILNVNKINIEKIYHLFIIIFISFSSFVFIYMFLINMPINKSQYDGNNFKDYTKKLYDTYIVGESCHLSHLDLNKLIVMYNDGLLQKYYNEVNKYYELKKNKILSPKELKEIESFYNFKDNK